MTTGKKQRGLTLIGFVMVLAIAGFFAFIGMKLFPVYTEYYSVKGDMAGLAAEPGVAQMTPAEVKDKLFRRFYISYVESVKNENVKVTRNNGYNLSVKYEVRRPLVFNLDFIAKFEHTVDLTRPSIE
jgi:Tfp pilus assembly protein PilE